MFISSDFLGIEYGVDDTIGRFYVDREPPVNNLYWHKKLLYLGREPGWLFIPLIADLFYRSGITRNQLISDDFVLLMEAIGHLSALEETQQATHQQTIDACTKLVEGKCKSQTYFSHLTDYINGGTNNPFAQFTMPYKALHRGDYFLFSICALVCTDGLAEKLVKNWFALIGTLLLLDDAEDIKRDQQSGDLNAFVESGMDKKGVEDILKMVKENLAVIRQVSRPMARKLDDSLIKLLEIPLINSFLNQ